MLDVFSVRLETLSVRLIVFLVRLGAFSVKLIVFNVRFEALSKNVQEVFSTTLTILSHFYFTFD